MKLEAKKQDIEKLMEQEKALYSTFTTAIGENNKFDNFLTKVFKKKIKRAKKKAQVDLIQIIDTYRLINMNTF
jgi:hypothetical protein